VIFIIIPGTTSSEGNVIFLLVKDQVLNCPVDGVGAEVHFPLSFPIHKIMRFTVHVVTIW
jgi:hypothetical protein